jgi:hypothetical protein
VVRHLLLAPTTATAASATTIATATAAATTGRAIALSRISSLAATGRSRAVWVGRTGGRLVKALARRPRRPVRPIAGRGVITGLIVVYVRFHRSFLENMREMTLVIPDADYNALQAGFEITMSLMFK